MTIQYSCGHKFKRFGLPKTYKYPCPHCKAERDRQNKIKYYQKREEQLGLEHFSSESSYELLEASMSRYIALIGIRSKFCNQEGLLHYRKRLYSEPIDEVYDLIEKTNQLINEDMEFWLDNRHVPSNELISRIERGDY